MFSDALEFDRDIVKNVARDQRRIAEAYGRAKALTICTAVSQ